MGKKLDEDTKKAIMAIRSIIAIADTNFPGNTEVVISANGKNTASVSVPNYLLDDALKGRSQR